MKAFLVTSLIICLISCTKTPDKKTVTSEFDFLIGSWERTNSKADEETFEHWKILSNTEYLGHGYTLSQKDTTFQEHMHLLKKDSLWTLKIAGPNETPIAFKVMRHTPFSFEAENLAHDFPKKIRYSYFDDTLSAKVSNEDIEIPFIFWRIEKK